jgi:outer membrane protein assembly factor BamB
MGKFNSGSNNLYQELDGVLPNGIWSMPAIWNGNVYYGRVGGPILDFQFKNAKLLQSPVAQTQQIFPYPGVTPSISTNGEQNAILWATAYTNPGVLFAFSARGLQMLYNSTQAPDGRDNFGNGNKFITPMISNGKVYVGTQNGVAVFGLLSGKSAHTTAVPEIQ